MKDVVRVLDAMERLIRANAELRISTLDESLRAARSLERLRELIASGVNTEAIHLAINVSMAVTSACIRESLTISNGLSQAKVAQARDKIGPNATQEQIAAELGVESRTLRRWLNRYRQLKSAGRPKGRPRALKK